ncbi:MAG: HNH endonuclease signature motif containing protein [Alloprevotella sp.]
MAKDQEYNRLIHKSRWLRLRRDILTAHPLCQCCQQIGKVTPATEVHHVRPVEEAIGQTERKHRMYDPNNLMALCHDCHVRIHTELGRCGKEAVKKRNERQVREVVHRFFGDESDESGGVF